MLSSGDILNNRYRLKHILNNNALRQTWLAEDKKEGDRAVVKILNMGASLKWEDLKLFEREAKVIQELDKSQLPKYRDYFALDESNFLFALVTEYVPGVSLKEKLKKRHKFTGEEIEWIATEVLENINYLHELNPPILHRDIKPSNLIWGEDDRIHLIDFGSVQIQPSTAGATFTVVGSYGYTPLEQFGGKAVPASDLYALGTSLVHLLTGVLPAELPQKDFRILFRDRVNPDIKPKLISWLEKLTEPGLEKRFTSAKEALASLQAEEEKPPEMEVFSPKTAFALSKTDLQLKIEIPSKFTIKFIHPIKNVFGRVRVWANNWMAALPEEKKNKIIAGAIVAGIVLWLLPEQISIFLAQTIFSIVLIPLQMLVVFLPVWVVFWIIFSSPGVDYFQTVSLYLDNKNFEIVWHSSTSPDRKQGEIAQIKNINLSCDRDKSGNYHSCLELIVQERIMLLIPKLTSYYVGQQLPEAELELLKKEISDWISVKLSRKW
ncbi:MAG: serine/threonine-protein kinase [Cyanobacteriota bacterium]|nr:serine/threonine-protein kinase [Cyanobacteriota bacterium]